MKIQKKEFQKILFLGEYLEFFLKLIDNGANINDLSHIDIKELRYVIEHEIRLKTIANSKSNRLSQTVKLDNKYKDDYVLLKKYALLFSKVDQSRLVGVENLNIVIYSIDT